MSSSTGETSHGSANQARTPPTGYETRDANPRGVLAFLAGLFLVICLTLLVAWLMFRHFSITEVASPPASTFADVRQVPSGLELQVDPRTDLLETRAKQQEELETYSWEDRKAGLVRIPIDQAMDLLLQKGLPILPSVAGQESTRAKSATRLRETTGPIATGRKSVNGND